VPDADAAGEHRDGHGDHFVVGDVVYADLRSGRDENFDAVDPHDGRHEDVGVAGRPVEDLDVGSAPFAERLLETVGSVMGAGLP
jgi:hypothetical protein